MKDPTLDRLIRKAAVLLRQSTSAVAFTGAGISTSSGIPDFRSTGTGLWETHDPMQSASIWSFRDTPERFDQWLRPLAQDIVQAEPNPAHIALAQLEQAGKLSGVVTQNIDNLHFRAGSQNVFEIHGHLRENQCLSCHETFPAGSTVEEFARTGAAPQCPYCNERLKPAVVLFGEDLPGALVEGALELLRGADLLLVAGSSLVVAPASYFPLEALDAGAELILVNLEPTYLDSRASVVVHDDVAEILPAIAREVLSGTH